MSIVVLAAGVLSGEEEGGDDLMQVWMMLWLSLCQLLRSPVITSVWTARVPTHSSSSSPATAAAQVGRQAGIVHYLYLRLSL